MNEVLDINESYFSNLSHYIRQNDCITFPTQITVAAGFYSDHVARDCGQSGIVIKETKTRTTILLDAMAWDDLYSDALYYIDLLDEKDLDPETYAFARSALRVLRVMDKHEDKR